ncbi:MAG: NTP transferase domain-containing protein [Candidatus Latescibacteria bacterium]|nr:NTP transferase domain-containing protein [Candidatus Latescibacterota bacterium]NIM22101.1 NTP transferase domain-containing protein [Candidatus Latescibacterota bacterium]NIM66120.1 NTP transferase domain-containing protein [Candidatus Latescibacterota bacterium]NIO02528.1 NTP transferase domain-containing protein [Candidatus Latescibacterota bacterium]NIO29439.1 NTP transferase domain-containing protein [Candidatus Latescibacterota bacterium]
MKAVVPAAGIGKRLRPHTYTLPKALLYVAGKPIISHILDDVLALDPTSVILIIGYKAELVKSYVQEHYPKAPVEFVFQEERRGIGHAIHLTEAVASTGEPLLIILGDTIIKADLRAVIDVDCNVLGVKSVEDPRRFGVCEIDHGRITRVVEKPKDPPSNLALVGLYYLPDSPLLFECLKKQIEGDIQKLGEYQVTDALQMMIDRGAEFRPFSIEEWFDCGKKEALLETNRSLLEGRKDPPIIEGSIILPPVSLSPNAEIENSIIGPYVSIASHVVVRNSIIRDSVIDEGAAVKECLLDGSIVGSKAVIVGAFQSLNVGDSCEVNPK